MSVRVLRARRQAGRHAEARTRTAVAGQPDQRCAGQGSRTSLLVLRGMVRRGEATWARQTHQGTVPPFSRTSAWPPDWLASHHQHARKEVYSAHYRLFVGSAAWFNGRKHEEGALT